MNEIGARIHDIQKNSLLHLSDHVLVFEEIFLKIHAKSLIT